MRVRGRKRRCEPGSLAALAALAAVSACGDDPTGPGPAESDVVRAHEEFTVIRVELAANSDLAADVGRVTASIDTLGVPLPSAAFGTVYEWDEMSDQYVAGSRSGAPADGLRFLVYDRSATPFVERGFMDVRDETEVSPRALGVRLDKDDVQRLDYLVEADTPERGDAIAVGFVSGGSRQVDFDLAQVTSVVSDGFRIDLDFALSLAARPVSFVLDYSLNLNPFLPNASFAASFQVGEDELTIDFVQRTDNTIEGEVRQNGRPTMTVTDDGNGQAVFLGPEGEELAAAEERAIQGLLLFALESLGDLLPYLVLPDTEAAWVVPPSFSPATLPRTVR